MSSHGALPQELIDEVIDELGEVYRGPDREKPPANHINVARETLHACALVSKCWTGRCRAHLFKEVKIRADGSGILPIPSDPLMPHITKLKIQLRCNGYRLFPSRHLLTPFYMAPIAHLRITAGALATARGSLLECITALSATLQTVVFKSCSFSLNLVLDIVLTHPGLKQLHLHCCEIGSNNPDPLAIFYPGTHSTDTEIGLFSATDLPSHVSTIITTTQLPIQFSRLNFDYVQGLGMTPAAEVLIEASAKSLSSLTVHVVKLAAFRSPHNRPLFRLGGCFDLSELTLDMENASSCPVTTLVDILSTFCPRAHPRLKQIKLITGCVYQWLCKGSRDGLAQEWRNLDSVLSESTKAIIGVNRDRLAVILVSTHKGKLGKLLVQYERSRLKAGTSSDKGCFCFHEPVCLEEEYDDPSQG